MDKQKRRAAVPPVAGVDLLGARDSAAYLGYSLGWLNHLRRAGKGPEYIQLRPRGRVWYSREHLAAFIAKGKKV